MEGWGQAKEGSQVLGYLLWGRKEVNGVGYVSAGSGGDYWRIMGRGLLGDNGEMGVSEVLPREGLHREKGSQERLHWEEKEET